MLVFVIVMACILSYVYVAGLMGKTYLLNKDKKCDCRRGSKCSNNHGFQACWLGALWPFGLPLIAGTATARYVATTGERRDRKEKTKQIEHQRKLELIGAETERAKAEHRDAQSVIDYLEKNGIRANVPGMFETA